MKAAVLEAPFRFRLEERPLPDLQPGWVLVQVRAAGICGSDTHFYTGELPLAPDSVRGHEVSGTVVDAGDTALPAGQAVVIHPLVGCRKCSACQRGEQQLCEDLQGIGGQFAGGFAEYVAVPARNVYPFDASLLPFEHAALADCVAVAVHAMNKVRLRAGESAVVLGDGAVGLLLLQVALAFGASPVILIGKHERNIELGRELGAALAIDGVTNAPLAPVQAAAGQVDVVFEAVGGQSPPYGIGLRMLRKGGRLAVLGLTPATEVSLPWLDIVFGEQAVLGVMGYGTFEGADEMLQALTLMQSGRVSLGELITHSVSLDKVGEGFELMLDRANSQAIKVIVLPAE